MCATPGVQFGIGFQQSLGAGVFGGEGFMLQKVSGQGTAFVELYGEVVSYDLQAGETLRCHPGYCGMFEESVKMSVTTVPGLANKLFGGDGLFLLSLTGPGKIWLQSLTLPNLAHAISPYLPKGKGYLGHRHAGYDLSHPTIAIFTEAVPWSMMPRRSAAASDRSITRPPL